MDDRLTTVLSHVAFQCVTFVCPQHPAVFPGYRLLEGEPLRTAQPLYHPPPRPVTPPPPLAQATLTPDADWPANWQVDYRGDADAPLRRFRALQDGSATVELQQNGGRQRWLVRFAPEHNGVRIWMTLTTADALPGAYIVQQCLRFGHGLDVSDFRSSVSSVPFLSELLMQLLGNANGTLTWSRQGGAWRPFPLPFTRYTSAAGSALAADGGKHVDCGLIVRETASRARAPASYWQRTAPHAAWDSFAAGLYWQRSVNISNRHPADCVHVAVDFGDLAAGASRTIEGKIYWMEGTKEDLLQACRVDFEILT